MTGVCGRAQTPAGRLVFWSPETTETRGRGDAGKGHREYIFIAVSPRHPLAASSSLTVAEDLVDVFL
jgi:hypothetical protein